VNSLVVDTHAAIWYYAGSASLPTSARNAIDAAFRSGERIFLASISLIEVIYLVEKLRVPAVTFDLLEAVLEDPSEGISRVPLDLAVAAVLRRIPRSLVPDMPDRIIAATALHLNLPLVTADSMIRSTGIPTIWD
jgi:PIN domain nuclease of toxin-antitoxin system